MGAIRGLGALGDPAAIAPLQTVADGPKDELETKAAVKAVGDLRDGRKPSVELRAVRDSISDLQRENRDLRKELDEIKKKLEALAPKSAPGKLKPVKPTVKPPKGI